MSINTNDWNIIDNDTYTYNLENNLKKIEKKLSTKLKTIQDIENRMLEKLNTIQVVETKMLEKLDSIQGIETKMLKKLDTIQGVENKMLEKLNTIEDIESKLFKSIDSLTNACINVEASMMKSLYNNDKNDTRDTRIANSIWRSGIETNGFFTLPNLSQKFINNYILNNVKTNKNNNNSITDREIVD